MAKVDPNHRGYAKLSKNAKRKVSKMDKASAGALAKKAAAIFKKTRSGGKLTKTEAKTLAQLKHYKKLHRRTLSPEKRMALKKMKRSYTGAKRRRAAKIAWLTRRKRYGRPGRANLDSFKQAGHTRSANHATKGMSKENAKLFKSFPKDVQKDIIKTTNASLKKHGKSGGKKK